MRAIGQAERALSLMCARAEARVAFGKPLAKRDTILDTIAKCRADIDGMRHLVREAAHLMDTKGNTDAHTRQLLSIVKALVPMTVQKIADEAMQVHGAAGMCQDTPLATIFTSARLLRLADGPDEVHWRKAGQIEISNQRDSPLRSNHTQMAQTRGLAALARWVLARWVLARRALARLRPCAHAACGRCSLRRSRHALKSARSQSARSDQSTVRAASCGQTSGSTRRPATRPSHSSATLPTRSAPRRAPPSPALRTS